MYRPKPQQPQVFKLPKRPDMPSEKDLEFILHEADRLHHSVEQHWGSENSAGYLLVVQAGEDPVWSLYEGAVFNDHPLWSHASRDLALIHSLIFQCVPEQSSGRDTLSIAQQSMLTSGVNPATMSPPDTSKATLQGRLENMQVTSLIQSIQMSQMSGRLQLFDHGETAHIYFLEGNPVHAVNVESAGHLAAIEIMTWEKGEFRFFPEESTAERTVTRRMDNLIMEGITLLDQHRFLIKKGLKPDSYLFRKEQRISPEEFTARVAVGAQLDLNAQRFMYECCDGRTRFQDILSRLPLTKVEWVPLVFNLVSCGLVVICQSSPFGGKAQQLVGSELDRGMIAGILRSLLRPETGMYSYAALQFFIEREFFKSISLGMPLSLIVFESRIILGGDPPQPLPAQAFREIAQRAENLKRPFDILAHYETFDFAFLLPGSTSRAARMFAHKLEEMLINVPLMQGQTQRLLIAGGLASTPEDTQDLGRFVAASREAKNKAREARVPLKAFSEL